jgi:hypothetical protein
VALALIRACTSTAGIITMWLRGVATLMFKYGENLSGMLLMLWVKIAAVTSLTVTVILIERVYARVRQSDVTAGPFLPRIGPIFGISSPTAMIFAGLKLH